MKFEKTDPCKYWCFTYNNPTEDHLTWDPKRVKYAVYQKEIGESGTVHFQGFVIFYTMQRLSGVKKILEKAHWGNRYKGSTNEAARNYCFPDIPVTDLDGRTKREAGLYIDGPWEFGSFESKQGARNDIYEVRDKILNGSTRDEIYIEDPEVAAKYPKYIDRLVQIARDKQVVPLTHIDPRPWQADVIALVNTDPDPRKVYWYYDPVGNAGKTYLAKYLIDNHNAFYSCGGKAMDITYSYNYQPIVILDYVRDAQDYVNYSVLEMFKNGLIQSNKYESTLKRINPPHLIIFANFLPDETKMSADRWVITQLSAEPNL